MHLEFLVEDQSGRLLLETLIPKLLGEQGAPHTWRLHPYKGVGHIPKDLGKAGNPAHRILLDQLPRLLGGYGKTQGIDAVVVLLDADRNDCRQLLRDLQQLLRTCKPAPNTLFRLAIEEMEAWYFGDENALLSAYPKARPEVLARYRQDTVCDTWEMLADAIHEGGSQALKKARWPLPGQVKSEWAERIGPLMKPDANLSPSFAKFRDGVRALAAGTRPRNPP